MNVRNTQVSRRLAIVLANFKMQSRLRIAQRFARDLNVASSQAWNRILREA